MEVGSLERTVGDRGAGSHPRQIAMVTALPDCAIHGGIHFLESSPVPGGMEAPRLLAVQGENFRPQYCGRLSPPDTRSPRRPSEKTHRPHRYFYG